MTDKQELEPCPVCKGTDLYIERPDLSSCEVVCNNRKCGIRGPATCCINDNDARMDEEHDGDPGEASACRLWNELPRALPQGDKGLAGDISDVIDAIEKDLASVAVNGGILVYHPKTMKRILTALRNSGAGEVDIRDLVATLYCASGCDCCRDTATWEATAEKLGKLLDIPRYSDDTGYDFYSVRDAALSKLPDA